MDFASLYPSVMQSVTDSGNVELERIIKMMNRNKKLKRILNNINNER